MKTSDIRIIAFKVAVAIYEDAKGHLDEVFSISKPAASFGVVQSDDVISIERYLISSKVMESPYIGNDAVRFTSLGIRVIEASLDRPGEPHGPFPPLSIVIGNIASGAQLAIGSGSFNQTQSKNNDFNDISEIVRLVQTATREWPEVEQRQISGIEAALVGEVRATVPDAALIRPALAKIGKIAETITGGVGTQLLLSYLKAHGLVP